ncbi:MAG: D-2-hydroxyacid dehydrogenase [Luteolibacter sp.]
MKIVVLDGFTLNPGDLSWEALEKLGTCTIHDRVSHDPEAVIAAIGDADAIYTNKTPLPQSVLEKCPTVKFIGVLATGYNIVDVAAANSLGMVVANVPTYGTTAVAQFTMALLLEMCHHVGTHSEDVRSGKWSRSVDFCYWDHPLIELSGKTLGIVGFGRIGQATAKLAEAFGLKILASGSSPTRTLESENWKYVPLDPLLAESDFISLSCPLVPGNMGLINKDSIAKMKDRVMIINTARGPLVVEQDLADALNSGKVAYAAVDVVSKEPILAENPLLKAKNCIITPHIAWAPKESRTRLMKTAVDNLAAFISGNPTNLVKP